MPPEICSQHQWITKIETLVPATARLNLRLPRDYPYVETVNGQHVITDPDAYNLSNSPDHDVLIQRAVEVLQRRTDDAFVEHLLGELTHRKTYGAFSELAAYDWMSQMGIDYTPQVVLDHTEVVNPNGSTLDGSLLADGKLVYFDIKAFGFLDHKIEILKQKLESRANGDEVLIEGSVSVSINDVQTLLEKRHFEPLVNELAAKSTATRGSLTFSKRPRPKVSTSVKEFNPKELAIRNREYTLRFGNQFARQTPFMLFFVVHPWFSQGLFHQNFGKYTDVFCNDFARLTFLSFNKDKTMFKGVPAKYLVRFLSAIAFINVWPQVYSQGDGPTARVFLNPNAIHRVVPADLAALKTKLGPQISITQI